MTVKKRRHFSIRPVNRIFIVGLAVMLACFAGLTCYYSASFNTRSLLLQYDNTLNDIYEAYYEKVYSFSDVYEPVFRQDPDQSILRAYFTRTGSELPSVSQYGELSTLMDMMLNQDNDIEWVALYNPQADRNYFLSRGRSQLSVLPGSFPYAPVQDAEKQHLLGAQPWMDLEGARHFSFCIQGGAIPAGMPGHILVGYSTDAMARILRRANVGDSVAYMVLAENQVVYDSTDANYGKDISDQWIQDGGYIHQDGEDVLWYAAVLRNGGRGFSCLYRSPWGEVFLRSMRDTPLLLLLLLGFTTMALGLYMVTSRRIFRRVDRIRSGLISIGQNDLTYRLPVSEHGDEFDSISESINIMTGMLQEAVDKEYAMRLKHMHLQLTQIQARFNPHFLFNTLEMIRSNLFDSGDLESAEYIEKLARIFRNLTDAKAVITLQDEIAFCSLYVSLLQLRYSGSMSVSYDVDPQLLSCGIIANLIQPAIENYFVHALDGEQEGNELEISCLPEGEDDICITIADNGLGAPHTRIKEINWQLSTPDLNSTNYGLMSIAKRIKLFYGDRYGVSLEPNNGAGLRVIIRVPRMSMAEHEAKLMPAK